ncbi:MAG: hypothetical protein ACKOBG_10830 [Actinomycetota bacterium]
MKVRSLTRSRVLFAALGLLVGLGATAAWAAIPSTTSGRIVACYPKTGAKVLRVIDAQAGGTCSASETKVAWTADGMRFRGGWSSSTAYAKSDVVAANGGTYVAVAPSTGKAPLTSPAVWVVLGPKAAPRLSPNQIGREAWWQDPTRPATIATGSSPANPTFDGTNLWVAYYGDNQVAKIDPRTNAVLATVPVPGAPVDATFDGTSIWVTRQDDDRVVRINPKTNAITATVVVGAQPISVEYDGSRIWVANQGAGTLTKINPATATVVATVTMPGGDNPQYLEYDGTNLWASSGSGAIRKINPATNALIGSATPAAETGWMAFDGRFLWASSFATDAVFKIDPATNAVVATVFVADAPSGLAFDGRNIWVAMRNSNTVRRIDAATNSVTGTVAVGVAPTWVGFDGSNIWVSNENDDTLSKIRP